LTREAINYFPGTNTDAALEINKKKFAGTVQVVCFPENILNNL